jgi:hypothetical protein
LSPSGDLITGPPTYNTGEAVALFTPLWPGPGSASATITVTRAGITRTINLTVNP